ncbi:MAG TPA: ArgE/DapE family deacylase [Rhodothermales bacterium]|nr:ArgE/DapE family deacylase [Rhodothermales bacterium]
MRRVVLYSIDRLNEPAKDMEITIDRADLVRILTDLVQIDSTNPLCTPTGAGEADIAAYVADTLRSMDLHVDVHETEPGRPSVVGTWRGSGGGRSLMLNAHMDTVGVEGMEEPFSANIRDGKLYGRGAQDMKGSLAACIAAVKALQQAGAQLAGDVLIAAVADEEFASIGTADVIQHHTVDGAIVTEPTDMKLALAHKGFVWIEVETEGRAAHGSRPDEGRDANMRMGRFLAELDTLEQQLRAREGHPLTGPPSLHVGRIVGGTEWSVYAARCRAQVERRTIPGETSQDVAAEIQTLLDTLAADDPTFRASQKIMAVREPFEVAPEVGIVRATLEAATDVLGHAPPIAGQTFWTDAALLAEAGVETVVVGPIGAGLHTREEWVDIDSLVDLARILAASAQRYCA